MSSAGDRRRSSRKPSAPDSACSQLFEDMKTETSDGATEGSVKKEELSISNHGNGFTNTPDVIAIKEEEADDKDFLYCEACQSFFFNKCEVRGLELFIPDTPVPMGVTDRARRTLPSGLEIQKSSIPNAGLGVFNKGETVPAGAHFGPYQGELVDREEAMNSGFSWVVYMSRQCEKYIDAKRDMHANWMRYVNCARRDGEQNLVAFQYRGGILYRCCRPINPGQELLVWYEERYARDLGPTFDHFWNRKCSPNGISEARLQSFSCSLCTVSYTSQIDLNKHMKRCHSEEYVRLQESGEIKYEVQMPTNGSSSCDSLHSDTQKEIHCSDCGTSFTEQSALQHHKQTHKEEKPYPCSQCKKRYIKMGYLQRHQRNHTGEKPHQCAQCGKSFSRECYLRQHLRIHTGEKPYYCLQCGKSFNQKVALQQHQRIHTGEKPFDCSQCGKSFSQKTALKRHQRIHTGEKPYLCSQCGKSFTAWSNLRRHECIHSVEKPHHCSECGKSFKQKADLSSHQRIHTGVKPYYCPQCGKNFTLPRSLQLHLRNHTGEKPYHCAHCGKRFNQKVDLVRHQNIHTGVKPYRCLRCGKSFTERRTLQRHQNIHIRKDSLLTEGN